jgi:hypothetical protein
LVMQMLLKKGHSQSTGGPPTVASSSFNSQLVKMLISLLTKVTKLAWFDIIEMQGVAAELLEMCRVSAEH